MIQRRATFWHQGKQLNQIIFFYEAVFTPSPRDIESNYRLSYKTIWKKTEKLTFWLGVEFKKYKEKSQAGTLPLVICK